MGEIGAGARGREAGQRLAWSDAYRELSKAEQSESLTGSDLELLAAAAYLVGNADRCRQALQHAHTFYVGAGQHRRAARCLFWVAFTLLLEGDLAPAGGWQVRAERLLDAEPPDCPERSLLRLPAALLALMENDYPAAEREAADAAAVGRRSGDHDLEALARHFHGRALVGAGQAQDGLRLLDEAMVSVVSGEVWPPVAGNIYCSTIDACQEMSDVRRAREWTDALTEWCRRQPQMVTFTGQCLVHRAELLQLHGSWAEAAEEARKARERLARGADQHAVGAAVYRQAELHRMAGDFAAAARGFREAGHHGREPVPGLALLLLAEGRAEAARAATSRALTETTDRLRRSKLLPAHVEIMLATGDRPAAREAADELAVTARDYNVPALRAAADHAVGSVLLAEGEGASALHVLRRGWQTWADLDVPYEAARTRVLVATACRALGDEESATLEMEGACRVFADLGAAPDVARVEALLGTWDASAAHGLSPRELQVLRLVADGMTNRAIAAELVLAEKTVDRHVTNIFTKLGISSRAAATAYAYRHRLL